MAPSSNDLPKDAIAYRSDPEPNSMPELMVTNRVGDLHLNALLGPVFIEGGPLLPQLFQENVGPDSDGFICSRHLDPAVQRVQPLDEAFRLTPIVQAFPKTVLRAMLGAPPEEGAAGLRVPQCAAVAPASSPPPDIDAVLSAGAAPPSAAPPPSVAPPSAPTASVPPASACASSGAGLSAPLDAIAVEVPPPATAVKPSAGGPQRIGGGNGVPPGPPPGASAAAVDGGRGAGGDSLARGFGPSSRRNAILLDATYRGVLLRPSIVVRCPAERRVLTERLAAVFGLVSTTVKVIFQRAPGEWADLSAVSELAQALEDQPDLSSLPIQVSGEEMLHLPLLHALASVISIANVAILAFFMYAVVYVPQLPAPWSFMCALPAGLVFYNGYAALSVLGEEYLTNDSLRVAFSRKDGWLVMTMLVALLGPDAMLLFCRLQLPPLGASISRTAEQALTFWAFGLHVVQDAPVLAVNLLMHKRLALEWDLPSLLLLGATGLSLSFNLIWHVVRMILTKTEEDDDLGSNLRTGASTMGAGFGSSSMVKRRTLRKLDTSKYVGLSNTPIIGNMGGASMYEA